MIRSLGCVKLSAALLSLFLIACSSAQVAAEPDPLDWPNWLGPFQDHTSPCTGLVDSWDPKGGEGSNLLWKNEELGGRSTPIVMQGRLYTIVRDQPATPTEGEKVVCVNASTGEKLWEYRYNVYLTDVPDSRVGWSSVCGDPETGRIYVQSVSGYFCCLDAANGEVVWDRSLHEEFGFLTTYGGRTNTPIVFEDLVITSAVVIGWGDAPEWGFLARPAHRFLAFEKSTGTLRWLNGTGISPEDTTYSTPTVTNIGGQAQMVFASGDGEVWSLQPRTGKQIWHYPISRRGVNVSPLVVGDKVYVSQSEENMIGNTMGTIVALDGTMSGDLTGKELWQQFEIMSGKSSPIMVEGNIWSIDDRAKLFIFDAKTGKQIAKKALGTVQRSTPVYADGKVYCCTNNGRWYVLQPTKSGVKILHKLRLDGEANDGSPIVAQGKIYLPTDKAIYCIGKADATSTAGPLPNLPAESPASEDQAPAQVQVVPYDSLVAPGGTVNYTVRIYNSRGQFLREIAGSEAQLSLKGPGEVNGGVYTAPDQSSHEAALIVCKVGELTGTARVRVVPPLPWEFDFDDEEKVPLTWVGGRVRWVPQGQPGDRYVVKKKVLPTPRDPNNKLGTRSMMTMGSVEMSNYTIQADFALEQSSDTKKMSDFGLINSRYTLTVRSSNKKLRAYSWSPHDHRTYAEVEFDPVPNKWYTMKLQVEPRGSYAKVSGKLWVRGEAEPEEWTVEMDDPSPNLQGSPGLYGNAQEAEIYLDNVKVTANN